MVRSFVFLFVVVLTLAPFGVTARVQAQNPDDGVEGMGLNEYCDELEPGEGNGRAILVGGRTAYNWACEQEDGDTTGIDMQDVCSDQWGNNYVGLTTNENDPYSWVCVLISPAAVFPYVEPECPGLQPSIGILPGLMARVTEQPDQANHLRSGPGRTYRSLGLIEPGEEVLVVAGYICASNLRYWLVSYDGEVGFMADGSGTQRWLELVPNQYLRQDALIINLSIIHFNEAMGEIAQRFNSHDQIGFEDWMGGNKVSCSNLAVFHIAMYYAAATELDLIQATHVLPLGTSQQCAKILAEAYHLYFE